MPVESKKRIIFLDLMRAFAVLMMVQGHTIDTLLAPEFRTSDSIFYSIWHFGRGFTAPIFMFTAGVVYTYLLRIKNLPFKENPRVKKGLKRFLLLIVVGYILRYPTYTIFDFSQVQEKQWLIFFAVDALHLIGFGILFVIILAYIGEKLRVSDYIVFLAASLAIFAVTPIVKSYDWAQIFPLPIAAYFYRDTGSLFPFFPWLGYVFAGGLFGSFLAKNPAVYSSVSFSFKLVLTGVILLLVSVLLDLVQSYYMPESVFWFSHYSIIVYRLGMVILMNGIMSFIALKLDHIPSIINKLGRNTLLIYAVHLVILYGCAWMPGVGKFYSRSFTVEGAVGFALFMLLSMTGMVLIVEKIKLVRKTKIKPLHA